MVGDPYNPMWNFLAALAWCGAWLGVLFIGLVMVTVTHEFRMRRRQRRHSSLRTPPVHPDRQL